jgi:hypothetical protein
MIQLYNEQRQHKTGQWNGQTKRNNANEIQTKGHRKRQLVEKIAFNHISKDRNRKDNNHLLRIEFEQLCGLAIPILLQDCSKALLNSGHGRSFWHVTMYCHHISNMSKLCWDTIWGAYLSMGCDNASLTACTNPLVSPLKTL